MHAITLARLKYPHFLSSHGYCSYHVSLMSSAAIRAGALLKNAPRNAVAKIGEGHRSVITEGDKKSQREILSVCSKLSEAKFLCEEDSNDPRVLPREISREDLHGTILVVDPVDGTVRFAGGYPDWTIGIGKICSGAIVSGIIFAPAANGGMLLFSEVGHGVFLYEQGSCKKVPIRPAAGTPMESSVVLFGVDASLYPNLARLVPKITVNVLGKYDVGSGLFGLMMVALGRAQAVVQTPQKAWDWVPAYRAIINTGNVFRFFRLKNGKLIPEEWYDFEAFSYAPKHRLGFVAGEPALVKKLFDKLPKSGWARINPESVSGIW